MRKEKDMKYQKAIERLIEGIKADYANWSSWPEGIERSVHG